MPTSVPQGGSATITPSLYGGRLEVIRAKILIGADTSPVATEFQVDQRFNGQFFVNARFRRLGALPPGITFLPDAAGIRIRGVPQATGIYEALFEGPYPDNFVGTSTDGNAQTVCGGPQNPNTGVQSIYVFAWCLRFVVTTKSANSLTFGQLYRHMLGEPTTTNAAYREGWA